MKPNTTNFRITKIKLSLIQTCWKRFNFNICMFVYYICMRKYKYFKSNIILLFKFKVFFFVSFVFIILNFTRRVLQGFSVCVSYKII